MVDVVSELNSTKAELEKSQKKVSYLEDENKLLREKIRLMNARQFSPSSEAANQLLLFDAEPTGPSPEAETEEIKYNRKKPGRKGVSRHGQMPKTSHKNAAKPTKNAIGSA